MTMLGPNLEMLKKNCDKEKFSYKTTFMIADQIITRLEALHNKGYIHRDIKPENFAIGINGQS